MKTPELHASKTEPATAATNANADKLDPLPGEAGIPSVTARTPVRLSRKALLALALLVATVLMFAGMWIHGLSGGVASDGKTSRPMHQPSSVTAQPRQLDLSQPVPSGAASSPVRIPVLVPTEAELADPIGVRRTRSAGTDGSHEGTQAGPHTGTVVSPEDAPVMLVSTGARTDRQPARAERTPAAGGMGQETGVAAAAHASDPLAAAARDLQEYQQQLQGLLANLTAPGGALGGTAARTGTSPPPTAVTGPPLPAGPAAPGALFNGQLQSSSTPRTSASMLGNRSLMLPKGTSFTCTLKTKIVTATSGMVACQVQRNIYGDDGRVLLIERGSHVDGEYRASSLRPGTVRIPVLWTRIRTPLGVMVDIDSPATGALGESGIEGHVDNRWSERIGAAMLLSLIDDSVKLIIQNQADDAGAGNTIVLPSTTANTSRLAEKVLDSTINIAPLIYQNQGGVVGINVARDVDFSGVYALRPVLP